MIKKYFSKVVNGTVDAVTSGINYVAKHAGTAVRCCVVVLGLTFAVPAMADGSVDFSQSTGAINDIASGMENYIEPVQNVCYIIAALMGIIGGLSCALAMSNHEQDVTKKAAFTVGGVIFMVAIAQLIPLFFGMGS